MGQPFHRTVFRGAIFLWGSLSQASLTESNQVGRIPQGEHFVTRLCAEPPSLEQPSAEQWPPRFMNSQR